MAVSSASGEVSVALSADSAVTLWGTGREFLELGRVLAWHNVPLTGLGGADSDTALHSTLSLGCAYFADGRELLADSSLLLLHVAEPGLGECLELWEAHTKNGFCFLVGTLRELKAYALSGAELKGDFAWLCLPDVEEGLEAMPPAEFPLVIGEVASVAAEGAAVGQALERSWEKIETVSVHRLSFAEFWQFIKQG